MKKMDSIRKKCSTYDSENGGNFFRTPADLKQFGENQNEYNSMLAEKIEELEKRVSTLESEQKQNKELFKRLANELLSLKSDTDRLKLTSKLNTNTIDRLVKAIDIVGEGGLSETEDN